jgi:hypothetical protein
MHEHIPLSLSGGNPELEYNVLKQNLFSPTHSRCSHFIHHWLQFSYNGNQGYIDKQNSTQPKMALTRSDDYGWDLSTQMFGLKGRARTSVIFWKRRALPTMVST